MWNIENLRLRVACFHQEGQVHMIALGLASLEQLHTEVVANPDSDSASFERLGWYHRYHSALGSRTGRNDFS